MTLLCARWDRRSVNDAGRGHGAGRLVGCCWSPSVSGNDAWSSPRSGAAQQGHALSGRPAERRGDRAGDEACWRSRPRFAVARADRGDVARRPAHRRGAGADRGDLDPGRGAILVRHGKGGKRREVGMDHWGWERLRPWLAYRVGAAGRPALLRHRRSPPRAAPDDDGVAPSCGAPRRSPGYGAASRCISFATLTPSRWRAKVCR